MGKAAVSELWQASIRCHHKHIQPSTHDSGGRHVTQASAKVIFALFVGGSKWDPLPFSMPRLSKLHNSQ